MSPDAEPSAPVSVSTPQTALVEDVGFLLARASAVAQATTNAALVAHDLKVRSYSVLTLVASGARLSQRELALYLRLDPSQVVSLIDDLERQGLLARRPDPRDRRANLVEATPAGRALHRRAARDVDTVDHRVVAALSPRDRAELMRMLRTIAFPADA